MFKRTIHPGLICLFDADQEHPLKIWDKKIRYGQIKRTVSDDVKGFVLEITSKVPISSYIQCPANVKQTLGIHFPFFHLIVKQPFTTFFAFDIQVLDDRDIRRRYRASTVQTFIDIQPFMCLLPLSLETGWNQITVPLQYYTKNIYGTNYMNTLRVALYPNCLLKKIYFSDKEYPDEDIPIEFQLEDTDISENYRLKYMALVNQKRKNSLSYYPDLINKQNKTVNLSRSKFS